MKTQKVNIPTPGGPDRTAELHAEQAEAEARMAAQLKQAEQDWPGCLPVTAHEPAKTTRRLR